MNTITLEEVELRLRNAELLQALKDLRERLHRTFKLDVRKHFSLLVADAQAGTAISKAENKRGE